MNANDLATYQVMLRERGDLLRFMQGEYSSPRIGIYIPVNFAAFGHNSEASHHVVIGDKPTIDAIMVLALPAAKERVAEIERKLTSAGVEFSA